MSIDYQEPPVTKIQRALLGQLKYELIPMKKTVELIPHLPPQSTVSVTASPVKGPEATLELCELLVSAGHRVVPHLAARSMDSHRTLHAVLAQLQRLAIDEVFVIAGDAPEPVGPWFDAVEFMSDLAAQESHLRTVGFAAYPDGHAFISDDDLGTALRTKQQLVASAGLQGHVSTQMCFDPDKIADWLKQERAAGFSLPVHLGVPGSVDRTKLLTMGMRLGVGASLRYLKKNKSILGSLMGARYNPEELIGAMAPVAEELGISAVHCFTFNQVQSTVAWQAEALAKLN